VVADVRRLGEVQAGADKGGERCLEMLPCPLSWQARAMAPAWESFPEVNRVLAGSLLALLVERMVRAADSRSGGERGERHGEAALGAG
jgi:hypothetical protein